MKQNYFKMALVAIMLACASFSFTSCDVEEPDFFRPDGNNDRGYFWENIRIYILEQNGPEVVFVQGDGDHYYFYWSENHDTLYVVTPKPVDPITDTVYVEIPVTVYDTISTEVIVHDTIINDVMVQVYDTIYQIDTVEVTKTEYIDNTKSYRIDVVYGEENDYSIDSTSNPIVITITFAIPSEDDNEDYDLDIKSTIRGNLFESLDPTSFSKGGKKVLSTKNNRNGELHVDTEGPNAATRRVRAANSNDTVWVTSVTNAHGTANSVYTSYKQSAGTRDGFAIYKDSCVYAFEYDGIDYKMNIAAESATGTYDGKTKEMLAALPESAEWDIVNTIDSTDMVIHEGHYYYRVNQVVRGTFTSRVMPERGSSRTHTDVVTIDNDDNIIYVIGGPVPDPVDPEPADPVNPGFVFPDGEHAIAAQISVVVDRKRGTLEEAILIHTAKSLYWVVSGTYVGSTPCTNHSLYNSLYMQKNENGVWVWTPAYLVVQSKGVMWYTEKGGSELKGMPKDQIDYMLNNETAHITTNYTGSFVRNLTLRNVGQTTTFSVDNEDKFTASSSTVTH